MSCDECRSLAARECALDNRARQLAKNNTWTMHANDFILQYKSPWTLAAVPAAKELHPKSKCNRQTVAKSKSKCNESVMHCVGYDHASRMKRKMLVQIQNVLLVTSNKQHCTCRAFQINHSNPTVLRAAYCVQYSFYTVHCLTSICSDHNL